MKLTLSQNELELAVRSYVMGMIALQPGTEVTIDFKAGRGENGISAEVDISHLALAGAVPAAQAFTAGNAGIAAKHEAPAAVANVTQITPPATGGAKKSTQAAAAPAPAPAAAAEEPPFEGGEPAKEETPTQTRQTTGKSLFGAGAAQTETPAANDGANEEEPAPAVATGGRRTLFSQ